MTLFNVHAEAREPLEKLFRLDDRFEFAHLDVRIVMRLDLDDPPPRTLRPGREDELDPESHFSTPLSRDTRRWLPPAQR